jgi:putative oxidoreductase
MLDRPADSAPRSTPPLAAAPPLDLLPGSVGDLLVLVGRIAVAQIYVVSGFGKLMGLSAFAASLARNGVPMPEVLAPIGAVVEFFGGLAVLLGFKTRWSAALILLFTIVATFIGHRYWDVVDPLLRRNQQTHFYKNVTIMGGLLFLIVTGGGRFSIDGLWRRGPR